MREIHIYIFTQKTLYKRGDSTVCLVIYLLFGDSADSGRLVVEQNDQAKRIGEKALARTSGSVELD